MEAGVFLALNESTPPELIIQAAQAVEERGFHAIWVPEHVVLFDEYESKYPYTLHLTYRIQQDQRHLQNHYLHTMLLKFHIQN